MTSKINDNQRIERRLKQARLEVAALAMIILRDQLAALDLPKLLLRTDAGTPDASHLILQSDHLRGFTIEDAEAEVELCMSTRRTLIEASGLFDAAWYLSVNDDVARACIDPLHHFNYHGSLELRAPGPSFDCFEYLHINADVAEAQVEPFFHYLLYGSFEGRQVQIAEAPSADKKTMSVLTELPTQRPSYDGSAKAIKIKQEVWLSDLFAEITNANISVQIESSLMLALPVPLMQRLSASNCIDILPSFETTEPFSIAFSSAKDPVMKGPAGAVCVKLLEAGSVTLEALREPTYRVGKLVDLNDKRRRIEHVLPPGSELSPVFFLYHASDRVTEWPAIAIKNPIQVEDDRNFARSIAVDLILHHVIMSDGAGAMMCLDKFDRRFGSDLARRFKAITGSYA